MRGGGCLRLYTRRDWGFKRLNLSINCQIKVQLGDSCLNVDPVAFFDLLSFPWITQVSNGSLFYPLCLFYGISFLLSYILCALILAFNLHDTYYSFH